MLWEEGLSEDDFPTAYFIAAQYAFYYVLLEYRSTRIVLVRYTNI